MSTTKRKGPKSKKSNSKGLGDTIEKVTKATGIKKLVEFVAGEDCGCEERKEKLNEMFPYVEPKCLTEDEYHFLHVYFKSNAITLTTTQRQRVTDIWNRVFSKRKKVGRCSTCYKRMLSELRKVYGEYEPK